MARLRRSQRTDGSAVDRVLDAIQCAIIAGDLKPGQRLPTEPELVRSLGLGRYSVREAVKMLVAQGVLVIRRPKGTFVADGVGTDLIAPVVYRLLLSERTVPQLQELRIFFERALLELAARRATADDVQRLQAHVNAFRTWATPRATHDELTRRDFEFHHLVAEVAGSPLLKTLYEAFVRVYDKALHRLAKEEHIQRVLVHHQKMVDCIRARQDDPTAVRKLVEDSLDVWWREL